MNFIERVCVMNFEDIRALFGIKPKTVKSLSENNSSVNSQEHNKDCDFNDAYETVGESSRAEFLATQNIQSKKAKSKALLSEADVESLKKELLKVCNEDEMLSFLSDKESTNILNAITEDATREIALKRLENFKKMRTVDLLDNICSGKPNASFILDNLEDFEIVFNRENSRILMADLSDLINLTDNKEILGKLKEHASDSKEFLSFAQMVLYDSKDHDINFGDETVVVDSAFLIHLLSEFQDWRGYEEFNEMVENLTERSHRNKGELNYYKLAEGILRQKPELYEVVRMYQSYINVYANNMSAEKLIQKRQEFFEKMEQRGILPKAVELRTIVPDKNALLSPQKTCQVLYAKGVI